MFIVYKNPAFNYIIDITNNNQQKRKKSLWKKKTAVNPNEEIIKKLNAEREELFGKMTRLANAISDPVQVSLLEGQLKAMQAYDDILQVRIKLLK